LFSGVALAAALAGAGFYLFFANVPERGAAAQQVASVTPQKIDSADINRMVQERNAYAPKPGEGALRNAKAEMMRAREEKASGELAAGMVADVENASDARMANVAPAASPTAPAASLTAPASEDEAYTAIRNRVAQSESSEPKEEGERLFRNGLYPEALAYWRQKAEAGDRWAAYRLGVELLDGKPNVVTRDVVEGAKFMLQSAKSNEPRAQFEMGSLYEYGNGVPADLATASEWYRKAAERGYPQAQYNYATMLESGDGVLADQIEALKYYTLAAEQGFASPPVDAMGRVDNNAPTALDRLRMTMAPKDVREAEQRAAAFKPVED
jgi:TPR repeat protein